MKGARLKGSGFDWTIEAQRELTRFWMADMPTAEIAGLLHTTKNSVIAKARRIGLPGRGSPIIRDVDAPVPPCRRKRAGEIDPKSVPAVSPSSEPFVHRRRAVPEVARVGQKPGVAPPTAPAPPVCVSERVSNCLSCQWPSDAPPGEWPRFRLACSAPITRGSYCAEHAALAYIDRRQLLVAE